MSWSAEPPLTGPCGGGFFLVRPARGRAPALLDAFTSIPGRDLPPGRRLAEVDEVLVPFDEQTTQVFHAGPAACAVPGVVAGMAAVHGRYGSLPWRSLLLPAAEAADRGVATNAGQQRVFAAIEAILTRLPESRELFSPRRPVRRGRHGCPPARAGPQHRAAGRARPRRAVHGRPRAGDGWRPGTARRQADDGRPGRLPPGVAAAAGRVVRGPRASHQQPAVVGRRADRLHAGRAGRRPPGGRAGIGAGSARAGRDDALRRAAAGAGVRPPAAPRRPGRPRPGAGGGRGWAAERRAGARGPAHGRRLGDPVRPRDDAHLGR